MKRYILGTIALLAVVFTSCEKAGDELNGVGTLDLSSITATVEQSARSVDTDSWIVTVTGERGVVGEWLYSELPASVELRAGAYTVDVVSHKTFAEVSREGYFAGSQEVSIVSGETTTPDAVVCRIQSLKLQVVYEGEIIEAMSDDCVTTIKYGEISVKVGKDDATPVYFRPIEGVNAVNIDFTGTVDGALEHFSSDVAGVKVGQLRKIVIKMTYEDGDRVFSASIARWNQDDDLYVE